MSEPSTKIARKLRLLRTQIKSEGSITDTANAVGMRREWLARLISPKSIDKLAEIEERLESDG